MRIGLKRALISSVTMSAIMAAMPAKAQQAEAAVDSGEIVVTAQRRSEALERTPVAVAVVSSEALAKQAITSERDLQFAAPGLTVRTSQNDNNLNYSLRG